MSEVRWLGSGRQRLSGGSTIMYSGPRKKREHGVAIILSGKMSKYIVNWKPINPRLITKRLNGDHAKTTLIACYVSTIKEEFYNDLNATIKEAPLHDLLCLAGDCNAKVGNDRIHCPEAMGNNGLGTR